MHNNIWSTIFSAGTFNQMLRSATPVALAALGGLMTEHAGIMNVGMDGMILMGAFVAAVGSYFCASAGMGILAAVIFGVLIGLFFALFTVKLRSDEFIIGCALNTFALGVTAFLSREIFGLSGTSGYVVPSLPNVTIPLINKIPFVGDILSGHSVFVYVTWLLVLLMWLFVYRTPMGLWIRASGESPETLRTVGKNPERMQWIASIICGVFCSLAGAHLSLGYLNGSFVEGMSASRGFIAFACVIFSAANPSKAYLAALMFGFFDALGYRLQGVISSDLTATIPYLITVVMMVYVVVRSRRRRKKNLRQHESLGNLS